MNRFSSQACPSCGCTLRGVADRLVCDECGGILIPRARLAASFDHVLAIVEDGKSIKICPRCDGPLASCLLEVGEGRDLIHFEHACLWCPRDGVWLAGGVFENILLVYGKQTHAGARGVGHGGETRLRGHQRRRPARPKLPRYTSPLAGRDLTCPACTLPLRLDADRWTCERCRGTFVETPALEAMVEDMTSAPWTLPPPHGHAGQRACPVCAERLLTEAFETILLDRCPAHGVWFDPDELAAVLHAATRIDDRPAGVGGWIRRLFFDDA